MDETSEDHGSLIVKRSDHSLDSAPTSAASPDRQGFHRIASLSDGDISDRDAHLESSSSFGIARNGFSQSLEERGLGIEDGESRLAVGSKSSPSTPHSANTLLSSSSTQVERDPRGVDRYFEDHETGYVEHERSTSSQAGFEPFMASSDNERFHGMAQSGTEIGIEFSASSAKDRKFGYRTKQRLKHGRIDWLSITILTLAVYSTVFSGVWLVVALIRPRWGRLVTTTGKISPATASLLCAAVAKSIELSFVTVFVAFLGQVLSRKAVAFKPAVTNRLKGITIAEMSMRAWVMQPGTLITHWETVGYAAFTFLGVISLFAALMSMLYTTASDALGERQRFPWFFEFPGTVRPKSLFHLFHIVYFLLRQKSTYEAGEFFKRREGFDRVSLISQGPKLRFGGAEPMHLYGRVATQFANPYYIKEKCKTPISTSIDPGESENTCIQIEHAGQSSTRYHNYEQYLAQWTSNIETGNGSTMLMDRPRPIGMLYDNTTVQGSWIHPNNITKLSQDFANRVINNVSMAMPHAGVLSAAQDPLNNIIQPQDLNGLGEYIIRASVPSPAINILCANADKGELNPLVYTAWANHTLNDRLWPDGYDLPDKKAWLDQNKTGLDEIFGWGAKSSRQRPMFAKYPLPFNSIVNSSKTLSDSIYLLATTEAGNFTICSVRGFLTPDCSTEYRASLSGGSLTTNCEDSTDELSYHRSNPQATNGVLNKDWINVAIPWSNAISLNNGLMDGNASNARLLTQLILAEPVLDAFIPSIAEALAVLAGCTLLLSTFDAPFIHIWNYSDHDATLGDPQYQAFNATLNFRDYASGGTQPWQNLFHIVLFVIFVINVVCLAYLALCRGLVTDFIEPQNLFILSLNSSASKSVDGSPEKEQLGTNWIIKQSEKDQDQFYISEGETKPVRRRKKKNPIDYEMQSPIGKIYSRVTSTRNSIF